MQENVGRLKVITRIKEENFDNLLGLEVDEYAIWAKVTLHPHLQSPLVIYILEEVNLVAIDFGRMMKKSWESDLSQQ